MSGINKAILIGRLGRDPELKSTQSGNSICKLSVATSRTWTNKQTGERQEETEWHKVTVFGKSAEHCANYLAKGRQVYVEGRIKTDSYEGKDGAKRYSTGIIADTVQFLGGREDGEGGSGGGNQKPQGKPREYDSDWGHPDDGDIPF